MGGEEVENRLGGGVRGDEVEEAWRERVASLPRDRGVGDQAFAGGGANRGNLGRGRGGPGAGAGEEARKCVQICSAAGCYTWNKPEL